MLRQQFQAMFSECATLKVTFKFYLYLENLNLSSLDPSENELFERMEFEASFGETQFWHF